MRRKIQLVFISALLVLSLFSCDILGVKPQGYEVSGTGSFNGTYRIRADKEDWYVREDDDNFVLKKIYQSSWDDYGWVMISYNEYLTYRNIGDNDCPPPDTWECGIGADKPNVRVTPVF